jgi:hypothetical protein
LATYPSNPDLPQGTNETAVNPANWNTLVDNINAIGSDLVDARGDGQDFPGTDHTAGQTTDVDGILQAVKHMLADISGEASWYDEPAASLKSHDHSSNKGGAVPWSSIGSGNRSTDLHPEYPGAVWTTSLRGASPSGNNTADCSTGQDVVSDVAHNYYEATSSETSLQDFYVSVRYTLPEDFSGWVSSNAVQIQYRTESGASINCHVDVYVYRSGSAALVASSENNANTAWSTIVIDDSALGSWAAGDIMEIYLKLETRNSYYARVGKVTLSYTS